jgi:stress response protein SCP2
MVLPPAAPTVVPRAQLSDVAKETEQRFRDTMEQGAEQFEGDLAHTSEEITIQLKRLSANVIESELEQLTASITAMREQSLAAVAQAQASLAEAQTSGRAELVADLERERAALIERLDLKLSQAVTAFLVEALGTDADLGAQAPSLLKAVADHADELKAAL